MNETQIANKILEIYKLEREILNLKVESLTEEEELKLAEHVISKIKQIKTLRKELVEALE